MEKVRSIQSGNTVPTLTEGPVEPLKKEVSKTLLKFLKEDFLRYLFKHQ